MVLPVLILLHGIMYFMTSRESFWMRMMAEAELLYSHKNLKQVAIASFPGSDKMWINCCRKRNATLLAYTCISRTFILLAYQWVLAKHILDSKSIAHFTCFKTNYVTYLLNHCLYLLWVLIPCEAVHISVHVTACLLMYDSWGNSHHFIKVRVSSTLSLIFLLRTWLMN